MPASLPAMAELIDVPLSAALNGVPLLFAGLFGGVILTGLLARIAPLAPVVALGAGLQAAGLTGVAGSSTATTLAASCAVVGLGFGLAESGGVALVRSIAPARAERQLTALTGCVALVACLAPVLITLLASAGSTRAAVGLLASLNLLAAVALTRAPIAARRAGTRARPSRCPRPMLLTAVALFCYVGAESVLAGWSAVRLREQFDVEPEKTALATSAFWALLTLGRVGGVIALKRTSDPDRLLLQILTGAALLLAAATALSESAATASLIATGAAVTAFGPCYALLLGLGLRHAAPSALAGVSASLVAAGALGGAALAALTQLSDLTVASIIIPAVAASVAALTVLHLSGTATRRRHAPSAGNAG